MITNINGLSNFTKKVGNKAIKRTKTADKAMRKFPYRAIGIAFSAGALIALFFPRQGSSKANE